MPAKKKKETLESFMSHKVKNYAEYSEFMRPHNSDVNVNALKFTGARLRHNKVV
ncbi:MAG: hypothetical protein LBQ76_08520 [Candidatus Fibromonas sp.]|jgi:hypothetical protein|nr:hypothetical protein [Candidatus Fibromonas sp.]